MSENKISRLYEINSRIWLKELTEKYRQKITFDTIPEEEIIYLKDLGFDAVWLMGVWLPSISGRAEVFKHANIMNALRSALPDLKDADIGCSPYCIAGYEINSELGTNESIRNLKKRLNNNGIKLILDFVPNHLALDNPLTLASPELFILGNAEDLRNNPDIYFETKSGAIMAHGKDPYFPAWTDVAQLNYFNPQTQNIMSNELMKVASLSDGVRCDMAMLILKKIQKIIWGNKVFNDKKLRETEKEFWQEAITSVKAVYPGFIFIAEVYWGLEQELMSLGFDYCYDKNLYENLRNENIAELKNSVQFFGNKNLAFIENHDEGRAIEVFGKEKSKSAAIIIALTAGAKMFHQGQLEGNKVHLHIQLLRKPKETADKETLNFYRKYFSVLKQIDPGYSRWAVLETIAAWEGNWTYKEFVCASKGNSYLAAVNFANHQSQCFVSPRLETALGKVIFKDLLSDVVYERETENIKLRGFYLDMPPYGRHIFKIEFK
ncbi:MAG: alpha-amylase family glycosyl hydrolase [Elusimicrobia bacterium]|nr:alpha-amylase family glycosyl hydrolase [Elusimicrobiota bacterium]